MRLEKIAWGAQRIIDMAVYGGSPIVLAWGFRVATRDVDAVVRGDPSYLRRQDMIADEPCAVGVVQDAYLAAVAEHLAECWRLRCPDWVQGERRLLQRP